MRLLHCIWGLILLAAAVTAAQAPVAQTPAPPTPPAQAPAGQVSSGYTVFLRGTPIGREDVTVQQDAAGITIASTGRLAAPLNILTRRAEVRYRADWTPISLAVDVNVNGANTQFRTTFEDVRAISEGELDGRSFAQTGIGTLRPFVLPSVFFGSFTAVARRLATAQIGSEHRAFLTPQSGEVPFRLRSVSNERMQTGTNTFDVRRFELAFESTTGVTLVNVYADAQGTLLRINIASQGIDVVRDDLASSTARTLVYSNPGDEAVVIPATGFNLGATLTRPATPPPASGRSPAVVLVGNASVSDRDGVASGVPVLGQIAGAVAQAGFIAVRYDKRGFGQSGGRIESAAMTDLAEDVRAVVRWLAARRDVDRDRIAVIGYGEGAWVAMLAASRDNRIAAVVSIAGSSLTGAELVLEQQRQLLAGMNLSDAERTARIDMQTRINAAAQSGRGWEGIPPDVRAQADTSWFQSLLAFNPARVLRDVDQPVLFLHGQLDRQVPVEQADRLAELARTQGDSSAVAVVTVRGVNHLLVPAVTGEVSEYSTLQDRNVASDVTSAITMWLTTTFAAIR